MVGFYKCFKYDYVTADLLLEVLSAAPFLIKRHHSRGALPASFLFYLYFLIPFYALIDVIPPPKKKKIRVSSRNRIFHLLGEWSVMSSLTCYAVPSQSALKYPCTISKPPAEGATTQTVWQMDFVLWNNFCLSSSMYAFFKHTPVLE